jgi:hypothetical protein
MNSQAMRVRARDVVNLVFTTPVTTLSAHALQGVVQLFTGTMIGPQTPVVIIGPQHEPRLECEQPFLFCPADAKTRESSLHKIRQSSQRPQVVPWGIHLN